MKEEKFDNKLKNLGVVFLPNVGNSYKCGLFFGDKGQLVLGSHEGIGLKVLVLGESHYCDEDLSDEDKESFTRDVMNWYLEASSDRDKWKRWMNTFLKFERAFYNHVTGVNETNDFWNHVIFYNYLQEFIDGPRKAGASELYLNANKAFFAVLEQYQPDVVVVWGKRLWNNLPNERWSYDEEVIIGDKAISLGSYSLSTGKKVNVLPVYHPSCAFSWTYWHEVLTYFWGRK